MKLHADFYDWSERAAILGGSRLLLRGTTNGMAQHFLYPFILQQRDLYQLKHSLKR